ncbi:MAG: tetratricopeptide repeat protein, partial [Gammaproteobacteria bacterium]|nr:tetratricopeptide repeat protein [Gammaproteobacteria bacterium]
GQLAKAEKLLTRARDDHAPDWRVHSALGATLSARGNQQAAQIELSKALKLAPDHPSILNNLALSYALDGNHDQAETLLRRAAHDGKSKTKTKG